MALKKYHGSCSCGKVKFEAEFDLSEGTFKCNCSVCGKNRFWGAGVKFEALKITQGEADIKHWGENIDYHFCGHCGTRLFGKNKARGRGAVTLAVLDDMDKAELAKATIKYVNGLHDKFTEEPPFKELL